MYTSETEWLTSAPNTNRVTEVIFEDGMYVPISEAVRIVEETESVIGPHFVRTTEYPPIWEWRNRGRSSATVKGKVALGGARDGEYYKYYYSVSLPGKVGHFIGKLTGREPMAYLSKNAYLMSPHMKSFGDITPQLFEDPSSA